MAPVDPDRLRPKIHHIRSRLERLGTIRDRGRGTFGEDPLLQDAAVRNLQTSVEALLDIAHHIVAREGLGTPTSYRKTIDLLAESGFLPDDRRDAFRAMVGFRKRAVHLYDEIDPDEVFAIMEEDLEDFEIFIAATVQRYFGDR